MYLYPCIQKQGKLLEMCNCSFKIKIFKHVNRGTIWDSTQRAFQYCHLQSVTVVWNAGKKPAECFWEGKKRLKILGVPNYCPKWCIVTTWPLFPSQVKASVSCGSHQYTTPSRQVESHQWFWGWNPQERKRKTTTTSNGGAMFAKGLKSTECTVFILTKIHCF